MKELVEKITEIRKSVISKTPEKVAEILKDGFTLKHSNCYIKLYCLVCEKTDEGGDWEIIPKNGNDFICDCCAENLCDKELIQIRDYLRKEFDISDIPNNYKNITEEIKKLADSRKYEDIKLLVSNFIKTGKEACKVKKTDDDLPF